MKQTLKQFAAMFMMMLLLSPMLASAAAPMVTPNVQPPGSGGAMWKLTYDALQKGVEYAKKAYERNFNLKGNPLTPEEEDCLRMLQLQARQDKLVQGGQLLLNIMSGVAKFLGKSGGPIIDSLKQGIADNKALKSWADNNVDKSCGGKGLRGKKLYEVWAADAEMLPDTLNEKAYGQQPLQAPEVIISKAPKEKRDILQKIADATEGMSPAEKTAVLIVALIVLAPTVPVLAVP